MHIFDGKAKAAEIEEKLRGRTSGNSGNTTRVLHSIVIGDEEGAMIYQKMKQKAAARINAKLEIIQLPDSVSMNRFIDTIVQFNNDDKVNGIMLQLPLPENFKKHTEKFINVIAPEKDVDGMRSDSPFATPVVKAVMIALEEAEHSQNVRLAFKDRPCKQLRTLVVGSSGFVGEKLVQQLSDNDFVVVGVDENDYLDPYTQSADIIISATGVANLIGPDNVKQGAILIDLGAPRGDIEKSAYEKASFVSPVPGGIGPVTIACLTENLVGTE